MISPVSVRKSTLGSRLLRPFRSVRPAEQRESVFFFTFHKCASTLFGTYALRHAQGLCYRNVGHDYFKHGVAEPVDFQDRGDLYGPMRLSSGRETELFRQVISPATSPEFIRDRIALVLIRDPRDIAVSAYYSFGFSHQLSPVEQIRARQEKNRQHILSQTIDEAVPGIVAGALGSYRIAESILDHCDRSVLLKYEDMIHRWDEFARGLTRYLSFSEKVLNEIHDRSRPRQVEDIHSHQRSGKTGEFREKLQPETIAKINDMLGPVLDHFGYAH